MKHLIESLSLASGSVVVAGASAVAAWLLCSIAPSVARSLWLYLLPLVLAFSLYWSPVWLGSDPSEYAAWQLVCIGPWFVAGAVACAAVTRFLRKRQPKT